MPQSGLAPPGALDQYTLLISTGIRVKDSDRMLLNYSLYEFQYLNIRRVRVIC